MKHITLAISAAVLLAAGAGFAADQHGVAATEHGAGMPSETRAEAQMRAGMLFDKMDVNHDGKLDQADRAARVSGMFDMIDTNHDGMISRQEFAAAHDHLMGGGPDHPGMGDHHMGDHPMDGQQMPGHHMDGDHKGGHDGHMGHWGHDHREMHGLGMMILHRADPAHTGTVTRDAFIKAALALFDEADTNHDGVLTQAERRTYAMTMRQQMHDKWEHRGPGNHMAPPPPPGATPAN